MALTAETGLRTSSGNKYLWIGKMLGDGADATFVVPLTTLDGYWTQPLDEAAGFAPALSHSGHTITYAAAPSSGKYHYLFVIGSD